MTLQPELHPLVQSALGPLHTLWCQHSFTGLHCGRPVTFELSTRRLEKSRFWQGHLQTSADDTFIHTVLKHLAYYRCFRMIRSTNWLTYYNQRVEECAPTPVSMVWFSKWCNNNSYNQKLYNLRLHARRQAATILTATSMLSTTKTR